MELLILFGMLVVVFASCWCVLRLLAREFDREVGDCDSGRDRASSIRQKLVEL